MPTWTTCTSPAPLMTSIGALLVWRNRVIYPLVLTAVMVAFASVALAPSSSCWWPQWEWPSATWPVTRSPRCWASRKCSDPAHTWDRPRIRSLHESLASSPVDGPSRCSWSQDARNRRICVRGTRHRKTLSRARFDLFAAGRSGIASTLTVRSGIVPRGQQAPDGSSGAGPVTAHADERSRVMAAWELPGDSLNQEHRKVADRQTW